VVKALWDEDTREGRDLRVVVLGSASLLVCCVSRPESLLVAGKVT